MASLNERASNIEQNNNGDQVEYQMGFVDFGKVIPEEVGQDMGGNG